MTGFIINDQGNDKYDAKLSVGRGDWHRDHRFRLTSFFNNIDSSFKDYLNQVKDITLPDKEIDELSIKTPGTTYKFPKQANYSDLKIKFYSNSSFLSKVQSISENVHSISEGVGDYNKHMDLVAISIFGTGNVARDRQLIKYRYFNSWISSITHGDLSYSSNDIKIITVNVKFSYYEMDVIGTEFGADSIISNTL